MINDAIQPQTDNPKDNITNGPIPQTSDPTEPISLSPSQKMSPNRDSARKKTTSPEPKVNFSIKPSFNSDSSPSTMGIG